MTKNPRPFVDTLREVRGGDLLEELDDALHECNAAALLHEAAAEIRIKLTIKPDKGVVFVKDKVTQKLPVGNRVTVFYPSSENNLLSRPENQADIEDGLTVHSGGREAHDTPLPKTPKKAH